MTTHLGFYNISGTRTHVRFQFSTHASAGGNVAPLSAFEAADIRIYRAADSAAFSATQRSSSSGITMTSPFDSLTGYHDVDIDLTDNTDAGFYASGYLYLVVLAPDTETIDSQTITGIPLEYFEIGAQPVNVTHAAGTAWGSGAITAASIATDAIDNDAIAASAVTEIQSGLSTLDAAGVRSAVGLASANLDTQLDAIPTNTDLATALEAADDATLAAIAALNNLSAAQVNAEVDTALSDYGAAVPGDAMTLTAAYDAAKTASQFDNATDEVLANVKKINDATVTGNGSSQPWGPA